MSSAWGNQVERWRAGINAWVTSETDTTATIRVETVWQSVAWGYNVSNGVSAFCDCGGSDTPYVGTGGVYASTGETRTISMYTRDFTVPKTGSDRDVQCGAGVRLAGGYHDGTSRAYCTVRISHRTWYQPRRPASFAAKRSSDTSQSLTWAGDYTGLDGGYPWSGVYVDRGRDGATPSNLATLGWAATNYSDNSTEAGHRYDYRLYSYGPGGTSQATDTLTLYTTPIACALLEAYKPTATTVGLRATGAPAYVDSWEFQASTDGGTTWADAVFDGDWVCADPPKGTVRFRVRALKSSGGSSPVTLYGAWAESNDVATLCAPLAPLVSVPDVVATGTSLTIAWAPNHPDATPQTKAQVEVTDQAGATTTTDAAGAETTLVRPAASQAAAGSIRVRVRTHGEYDAWGEWSSYAIVRVAVAPRVAFSAPTAGMTLAALPLSVAWAVTDETGVSEQSLSIAGPSGATVWSASPGRGVRSLSVGSEAGFLNSTDYTLTYSMRAGSGLTLTKAIAFKTRWASPDAPDVSVTFDSSLAAHVRVTAATTGIAAVSFDVARVSGDGRLQLGTSLRSGHEVIDRLAPLNVAYSYEVTAHAATGATLVTTTTVTNEAGAAALNFGRDAGECWLGLYDPGHSKDVSHDATAVHLFNGNDLPEVYTTGERDVTRSYSFSVGESDFKRLDAMCNAHPYGWVREHDGERAFGIVSVSSSRSAPGWRSVSLKFTDCSWREPNVG
jgi:hypothetical protein|nr:MAG TPA: hypothetical protein [Caudoviricetes sp.]